MIHFIFRKNTRNLGDQLSSPGHYFDFGAPVATHDFLADPIPADGWRIVGGGGLLRSRAWIDKLAAVEEPGRAIAWGIGLNSRGDRIPDHPEFLRSWALAGVRDWPVDNHVTCASCMHPAFDRPAPIEHEVVIYHHYRHPVPNPAGHPEMSNQGRGSPLDEVAQFLASGATVITSSYHGAYWGLLLGRKVVVTRPHSVKFRTFQYQPPIVAPEDLGPSPEGVAAPAGYLEACREANRRFYLAVCDRLDIPALPPRWKPLYDLGLVPFRARLTRNRLDQVGDVDDEATWWASPAVRHSPSMASRIRASQWNRGFNK